MTQPKRQLHPSGYDDWNWTCKRRGVWTSPHGEYIEKKYQGGWYRCCGEHIVGPFDTLADAAQPDAVERFYDDRIGQLRRQEGEYFQAVHKEWKKYNTVIVDGRAYDRKTLKRIGDK